ncbi:penicillin-binding transpeptidase domain-containing protein [Nocardia donostiensis]|uniref:Penicillin-binding protein n=1 Tax=Nocardia donostiensis TaxID=1538463 RepID=A0A1W0AXD2_9NOCA|nr:penicillin-binding transpeptidase domain-containing protein [Nocardia donostiensis]ONM49368.1 penicillin-binding protein [Nocardia donostiensis]OQS14888.1 penicillin-binding protein [Nocardia donostiensis]OQS17593.1 penicillin-binding protein [Nocardia donostiensis]
MPIRLLLTVTVAALLTAATGCATSPPGPIQAAAAFVSAFAAADPAAAATYTTRPETAATALASAWEELGAEQLTAATGRAEVTGDTATVEYTYRWQLPRERTWEYSGLLQMGRSNGRWVVRWTSSNIHPELGDTQTMLLRVDPAPRARVNEQAGSDVLVPGTVTRVTFSVTDADDPDAVAAALSAVLTRFDADLTPENIVTAARDAGAGGGPHTVILLTETEFGQVGAELIGLPGVRLTQEWDLVPTERGFAPDLLTQVRAAVIDEVDGKAGWRVVTVNANGAPAGVLHEVLPQPAPSFTLSVDRFVQNAAQRAVDARPEQAMMVVIEPSTGAILAVAQNAAADRDGPIATIGRYPPGSVFKTVTAAAAIAAGTATPDTVLPCPSEIVIGERTIPNYNHFSVGPVPMATAYERSCNTSFAKLAAGLPADALHRAAASFGIGPDYTVAGLPTFSGSVPPADDLTQRIEDGIGQGRVVASPFGMALLAATIAQGTAPVPYLIAGRETVIEGERPVPDPAVIEGLQMMMRKVVTGGTAARIADQGEVYGKTGEAEVAGGSHSWFVGYRGDIAFAALLVRGGSSDHAVAVTREMLAALPPGY